MIKLNLNRKETTLDLGSGVQVTVRPFTTALMFAARADMAGKATSGEEIISALIAATAKHAIVSWEGVAGDDGQPAPVTPDNIDALMDVYPVAVQFDRLYLTPGLLVDQEVSAEKNG